MPSEVFLKQNPFCCFCGGARPTEQEDHLPPKILFVRKEWPENYAFPACSSCNQGSKQNDQALALLAQCSVDNDRQDESDFRKALQGVRNNMPDAEPERVTSAIEIRKILRQLGAEKPPNIFARDLNIAGIKVETFEAVDVVLGKLFKALHYMHVGRIVERGVKIFIQRASNQVRVAKEPFGWMDYPSMRNVPTIVRNGKPLTDQFDYRWGLDAKGVFGVRFHLRYGIFGVMLGPITDTDFPESAAEYIMQLP